MGVFSFNASTAVDVANLNSIGPFDAVVDGSLSANSGRLYTNVQDAIDAGARSIFVRAGTYYSGFTIGSGLKGITIIGETLPQEGAYDVSVCFTGGIVLNGSNIFLANLRVQTGGGGGSGYSIGGAWMQFYNCHAYSCGGRGFHITGGGYIWMYGCRAAYNTSSGLEVASETFDGLWITNCLFRNNSVSGVYINPQTSATMITAVGCKFSDNAAYGIRAESTASRVVVVGCTAYGNSTGQISLAGSNTATAGNITS